MNALYKTDLAAVARHYNGGSTIAFAEEADAFHQRAIGDALMKA